MSKKEYNQLEKYYQSLSEVYLAELEDLQEPIGKILVAKGILLEIESDLLAFLKKSKATDKSKRQEERIELLKSVLDYFSTISTTNYQMKLLLRKSSRDLMYEKKRHMETERALNIATEMLNAT